MLSTTEFMVRQLNIWILHGIIHMIWTIMIQKSPMTAELKLPTFVILRFCCQFFVRKIVAGFLRTAMISGTLQINFDPNVFPKKRESYCTMLRIRQHKTYFFEHSIRCLSLWECWRLWLLVVNQCSCIVS